MKESVVIIVGQKKKRREKDSQIQNLKRRGGERFGLVWMGFGAAKKENTVEQS
jgi:hypothetical protein